jgi:hypothetical protein
MAIWKQVDDWTYETFDAGVSPETIASFHSLVNLWQSRFKNDRLPAWRDFSFEDFNGWHGWLRVGDFIPGKTDDFRYRLWGVHSVDFYGVELTGKCMSELDFGFDDDDRELLTMLVLDKKITLATGPVFWQKRNHYSVSILKMPLADDGINVDKFLGAFRYR